MTGWLVYLVAVVVKVLPAAAGTCQKNPPRMLTGGGSICVGCCRTSFALQTPPNPLEKNPNTNENPIRVYTAW